MGLVEVIPSELDLFNEKALLLGVQSNEYIETALLNSVQNNAQFEFHSVPFNNKFKDLSNIYLRLKCKITKGDGTEYNVDKGAEGHLVSNGLYSIFRSCFVTINGTVIHSMENDYGYKEIIENMLNYQEDVVTSRFKNSQLLVPNHDSTYLASVSKKSGIFELYGRINMCNTSRLIVPNCSVNIKLNLHRPEFYMWDKTKDSAKLHILDAKLYVKHVCPSPDLMLQIERNLNSGHNAIYTYSRCVIKTANLSRGVSNMNLNNLYVGLKPKLAIMCMVKNADYSGSKDTNPFVFTHNSLSSFKFLFNGNGVPATPYEIKVSDGENSYYRIFAKLFETLGYADKSNLINETNFIKECFFISQAS